MNKAFISKTTQLVKRVEATNKRFSDLEERLNDLKEECDHRSPDGKLCLKTKRVPKRGSQLAYTYKECVICGEDVYRDRYGRLISVWNHLDIPEERKRELEKIMQNL